MKKYYYHITLFKGWSIILLLFVSSCRFRNSPQAKIENTTVKNEWSIIGPGAGGGVFIPSVSPFDTNLVFSKGDMTGNFVTHDGGKSWKLFNLMSVTQDFEFDPAAGMLRLRGHAGVGHLTDPRFAQSNHAL